MVSEPNILLSVKLAYLFPEPKTPRPNYYLGFVY